MSELTVTTGLLQSLFNVVDIGIDCGFGGQQVLPGDRIDRLLAGEELPDSTLFGQSSVELMANSLVGFVGVRGGQRCRAFDSIHLGQTEIWKVSKARRLVWSLLTR